MGFALERLEHQYRCRCQKKCGRICGCENVYSRRCCGGDNLCSLDEHSSDMRHWCNNCFFWCKPVPGSKPGRFFCSCVKVEGILFLGCNCLGNRLQPTASISAPLSRLRETLRAQTHQLPGKIKCNNRPVKLALGLVMKNAGLNKILSPAKMSVLLDRAIQVRRQNRMFSPKLDHQYIICGK